MIKVIRTKEKRMIRLIYPWPMMWFKLQATIADVLCREGYAHKRGFCAVTRNRPMMWFKDRKTDQP